MSQDSGKRIMRHSSEITNTRMLRNNARDYLEKALLEQEKVFREQEEALLRTEAQKEDLKKQLKKSEAQNRLLKKQLEQSDARNKVLAQRELQLQESNNSIMLEKKKAEEKVSLLSEEHKGLWDSSNQAFIHVKGVGVDINLFQTATSRNLFKEANIELLELWSLWADYTRDPSWHPFKVVVDRVGNVKEIIDEKDATLKFIGDKLGDEFYKLVTTALVKVNENEIGYENRNDPGDNYIRPVMWNFKTGNRATVKDVYLKALEWKNA